MVREPTKYYAIIQTVAGKRKIFNEIYGSKEDATQAVLRHPRHATYEVCELSLTDTWKC